MENVIQGKEAASLVVRRIPAVSPHREDLPAGFHPLRLLFHPGRMCLELVEPELLLGRHSKADIRLSLPDISRRHCRFRFSDGHWEVIDLNSLNGIYVNGERLQMAVLCPGDTLRVGSLYFVVELAEVAGRDRTGAENDLPAAVLKSIAEILPSLKGNPTEQYRKVS